MIVSFCGHSDYIPNPSDEEKILDILEKEAKNETIDFFLGGYGNFDSFTYHCAKKFKSKHKTAKLIWITPYIPYEKNDSRCGSQQEKFDLILYPDLEHIPPKYAIFHRNKWIVAHSDLIIAYVKRSFGGAYTMYRYAKKQNKKIYNLAV